MLQQTAAATLVPRDVKALSAAAAPELGRSAGRQLLAEGWTGDDLSGFILNEMGHLLRDDPRLSADHLAGLLSARGIPLAELANAGK